MTLEEPNNPPSTSPKLRATAVNELAHFWEELGLEGPPRRIPSAGASQRARVEKHSAAVASAVNHGSTLDEVFTALGLGCQSPLCATRKNIVFGSGNPRARLMFVGEGPGAEEDQQGLPFIGKAGQLLTKMIEAMGYKRDDVYIANVVKCRPPENRTPTPQEIACCSPYLRSQIAVIRPQVIVALGATSTNTLLGRAGAMSGLRGQFQPLVWDATIPVMPTFHPAYLLRNPPAKKVVWEDLKQVMARLSSNP